MKLLSRFLAARNVAGAALVLLSLQQVHTQEAGATIFQRYHAAEPAIGKATKEVEARHFDEAKMLLEPVLKQVPDHTGAHFLLAMMAYERSDFAVALDNIETSERSLKDLDQRYNRLLVDMKAKDEAEARDIQTSMDKLKAMDADGMTDVISTEQFHLDNLETKKGEFSKNVVSFAVPSVYSFLHGNCLYRLGRTSEAATQYQLAIHSNPANAKAWNNLINLYREAKDFDQARKALAEAETAGLVIQPKLKQSVLEGR
ncbi:MAG TPA: tetratricopeptide repeat protein [Holophagaceae bacterium]|jgi:tetratricopeptide (TPR) repeat protein|nr:tetratricopeptide repeat protein [Holophagaceae bacterium]